MALGFRHLNLVFVKAGKRVGCPGVATHLPGRFVSADLRL
jgi:hypothetical protein